MKLEIPLSEIEGLVLSGGESARIIVDTERTSAPLPGPLAQHEAAKRFYEEWRNSAVGPSVTVPCSHKGCSRSFDSKDGLPPGWAALHRAEDPPFYYHACVCPEHVPPGEYRVMS